MDQSKNYAQELGLKFRELFSGNGIIHRLETASGSVTVTTLLRFAEVLNIPIKTLFDFSDISMHSTASGKNSSSIKIIPLDSPKIPIVSYKTHLPLYSLKAAAGYFGGGEAVEPEAWVEVKGLKKLDIKLFVVRAIGNSMQPQIFSGDYLVFRAEPEGSRQGKVVLAQYRGPSDPDTGGSYTVKKYSSVKIIGETRWQHSEITLSPLNPEYESIRIEPKESQDFRIIAELVLNLGQ